MEANESTWRLTWLSGLHGYVNSSTDYEIFHLESLKRIGFEREIYYVASDDEVLQFYRKHLQDSNDFLRERNLKEKDLKDDMTTAVDRTATKDAQIEELKDAVNDLRSMMKILLSERSRPETFHEPCEVQYISKKARV
ncbi:hypothetical protein BGZ58_002374 [Dissophora ornata]|nr:hypothetical protein BGZ58_002374 [Dissophora ornata]